MVIPVAEQTIATVWILAIWSEARPASADVALRGCFLGSGPARFRHAPQRLAYKNLRCGEEAKPHKAVNRPAAKPIETFVRANPGTDACLSAPVRTARFRGWFPSYHSP